MTNRLLPAQDMEEVRTNATLRILVTYFAKKRVNTPKNMFIAVGTERPATSIAYGTQKSSSEKDLTAVHYKEL